MTDIIALLNALAAQSKLERLVVLLSDGRQADIQLRTVNAAPAPSSHADAEPQAATPTDDAFDDLAARRLSMSERVERYAERKGGVVAHKSREWAQNVRGLSARMIERAIVEGAVTHEVKTDGRDHRARLVRSDDLAALLRLIEAVKAERAPKPVWFDAVNPRDIPQAA